MGSIENELSSVIILANGGLVYWCIYAAASLSKLD